MAIKPQSIRKGVIVKFDNVEVDKQTVITASERVRFRRSPVDTSFTR
jgi:hypothetical protein